MWYHSACIIHYAVLLCSSSLLSVATASGTSSEEGPSGRYKYELSLNCYMSDTFGRWCGFNIHPLRPRQDWKLFGTILRLVIQLHMSSGHQDHHLKLAAIKSLAWSNGSKSNTYKVECFLRWHWCQIAKGWKLWDKSSWCHLIMYSCKIIFY